MKAHEAANIFPMMDGETFAQLKKDISQHGQCQPIITYKGEILDGRNRYRACVELEIEPQCEEWSGVGSAVAWVVSMNLHRRHLDESQRAMVGARVRPMFEAEAKGNQGTRTDLGNFDANLHRSRSNELAAASVNVSPRSVAHAKQVIDQVAPELAVAVDAGIVSVSAASTIATGGLTHEEQREIVAHGEREILAKAKEIRAGRTEARRQERVAKIAEIARGEEPLSGVATAQRYPLIYADPPWRYEHAESESRAIENQYPTMALDDICALPLAEITTDDAILFMWTTSPKLAEGMRVVESWGFTYRTCMVWDKEKIGMGYYARQQHELLLIATKGSIPVPPPSARPASVVRIPREGHSSKPHEFYDIIERMYPELPKLEMFCRTPRAGWAVWGNQSRAA